MKDKPTKTPQHKTVLFLRILYPIWLACGIFSLLYVPSSLIVFDDAAATANNISNSQLLFRLGMVGTLLTQVIAVFAALLLYKLFESVDKNQARMMVVFALVGVPIAMLSSLNQVAALSLTNGIGYLNTFTTEQIDSLIMLFLDLYKEGNIIASIFWGLWLFPLGYLIYSSGYFPKFVGIAVVVGGFGYLVGAFTHLLAPEAKILTDVCEFMTFGEVVFVGWLTVAGAKLSEEKP
jgi:hypothetical protein